MTATAPHADPDDLPQTCNICQVGISVKEDTAHAGLCTPCWVSLEAPYGRCARCHDALTRPAAVAVCTDCYKETAGAT